VSESSNDLEAPGERLECERVEMDYFVTAPCRVVVAEMVDASAERVFEVFCDARSWTRWAFPITAVDWTSPYPLEVGSTRTVHMRGGMVGWEEFIAWEPFRRMAFRFNQTIPGGPTAFAEDYVVTEVGEGRTRVQWTMAMTLSGVSARTMPVTRFAMQRLNAHMLRQFRRYVERGPSLAPEVADLLGRR
jgi:uncharacterized protein YndB with AHSA1/START domain